MARQGWSTLRPGEAELLGGQCGCSHTGPNLRTTFREERRAQGPHPRTLRRPTSREFAQPLDPPPQGCPQGLLPSPLLSLNAHPAPCHPTEDAIRTKIHRVSLTSLRASVTGRPGAEGSRKQSECGQCSASRGTDHGDRLGQRESRHHAEGPLRGRKATGSVGCWSPSVGNTSHLTVGRMGSSRGPGLQKLPSWVLGRKLGRNLPRLCSSSG